MGDDALAAAGADRQRAAGEEHVSPAAQGVILAVELERAAGNRQRGLGLDRLAADADDVAAGLYAELAAGDRQRGLGRDAVAVADDVELAALDRDEAFAFLLGGAGLDAVVAGADADHAAVDLDGFGALDAVVDGRDGDRAVLDVQVVLAGDAVVEIAEDLQRAGAEDVQIVLAEDDRAVLLELADRFLRAGDEAVFRALSEHQIKVLGLDHMDRGAAQAGDVRAGKRERDVALDLAGVDDDAAVVELAGDGIAARRGDRHRAAGDGYAAAVDRRAAARKRDGRAFGPVVPHAADNVGRLRLRGGSGGRRGADHDVAAARESAEAQAQYKKNDTQFFHITACPCRIRVRRRYSDCRCGSAARR